MNPSNILSNYVLGVSYILYIYILYYLYRNFGRVPAVEKFNPQLIFTIKTLFQSHRY